MPPRRRNPGNRHLPRGWRFRHGAYSYRVPPELRDQWDGKSEFRLGATLAEAYATWAERLGADDRPLRTVGELLDRYLVDVVPNKAPATQRSNQAAMAPLRAAFEHVALASLRPTHAYRYLDERGRKGPRPAPTAANRELEVLSHAMTKAIEWGVLAEHPIKGKVLKLSTPPRDRYVEDWELLQALRVAPPMLQAYLHLKLLTALRQGDLLRLRLEDVRHADGIHVTTRKVRRRIVYEWSDELRAAVDLALSVRRRVFGLTLFSTRSGQPYITEDGRASAWKSLWQRFMARVLERTEVRERFTEHDLRAKCASDAESLERARELLAHADSATTKRIYRRRPEMVRPLR